MLEWLQAADVALLRFINLTLSNPLLDWLTLFLNSKQWHLPLLATGVVLLLWKAGATRWRLLLAFVLVLGTVDSVVCRQLKRAIGRPRPFLTEEGLNVRSGRGRAPSMPSSHAANWFAGAMVCGLFYRRSRSWLYPAAGLVAFLRVYGGVHYPSDVLAGAGVGGGWALGLVWSVEFIWRGIGPRLAPRLWAHCPHFLPMHGRELTTATEPPN